MSLWCVLNLVNICESTPPCNQILLWANNEKILETLGHHGTWAGVERGPGNNGLLWGVRCEVRVIVWSGASVIINIPRSCQHNYQPGNQQCFYISIVWQGHVIAMLDCEPVGLIIMSSMFLIEINNIYIPVISRQIWFVAGATLHVFAGSRDIEINNY